MENNGKLHEDIGSCYTFQAEAGNLRNNSMEVKKRGHISQEKKRNSVYWSVYSHINANSGVQNIKCKIEPGLEEPQMSCEGICA